MSSRDQDLLDKLFEVEKKAEALVADARKQADGRIAAAKEKAEADYSRAHEAAIKEANATKAASVEATTSEYTNALAVFRGSMDATALDEQAFRAACETALKKK